MIGSKSSVEAVALKLCMHRSLQTRFLGSCRPCRAASTSSAAAKPGGSVLHTHHSVMTQHLSAVAKPYVLWIFPVDKLPSTAGSIITAYQGLRLCRCQWLLHASGPGSKRQEILSIWQDELFGCVCSSCCSMRRPGHCDDQCHQICATRSRACENTSTIVLNAGAAWNLTAR